MLERCSVLCFLVVIKGNNFDHAIAQKSHDIIATTFIIATVIIVAIVAIAFIASLPHCGEV